MMKKFAVLVALLLVAAIGCVFAFVTTPSYRGEIGEMSVADKQMSIRLQRHVEKLAGEIGQRNLPNEPGALERAAMYIEAQLGEAGLKPERQTFSVSGYFNDGLWGSTHAVQGCANIIAEIPGTTRAGAHYDSALHSPGANDNGSGVGAMLELARVAAKEKLPRTVRFVAFTNEEPPFFRSDDMGSARYAKECKERGDNIVAMISLETIGYYTNAPNTQRFPVIALAALYPTTGNFITFVGNVESRQLLDRCANAFNAGVKFPSEVFAGPSDMPGVDFSDHLNFWRYGYPAIMITDTANYRYPHYHLKTDVPDKVSYDHLARVTRGLQHVLRELASGP
jgi:hypothetical protein